MPPKKNSAASADPQLSLRFKYGIHTIFLFVDSESPFSSVTAELLDVLRATAPNGLMSSSEAMEDRHPLPTDTDSHVVVYGKLKNPAEPLAGFEAIVMDGSESASSLGISTNAMLAFTFIESDQERIEAKFLVEWPKDPEEDEG